MTTTRTLTIEMEMVPDDDPDLSYLEMTPAQLGSITAAVEDRRRLKSYGETWNMVGVRLKATITLESHGRLQDAFTVTTFAITTPGVWSVEGDSDDGYLREIADGEFDYLIDDLTALGFSEAEVREAYKGA
jgi:hypothetical protein